MPLKTAFQRRRTLLIWQLAHDVRYVPGQVIASNALQPPTGPSPAVRLSLTIWNALDDSFR